MIRVLGCFVLGWLSLGQTAPTTRPADLPSPAVLERRIAEYKQILTGNNEPATRVVGARELLNLPSPAAWDRVAAILKSSSDPAAQLAICQALASGAARRTVLIDPLLDLLGTKPPALSQAAAVALCRFKEESVIDRLSELASDSAHPEPMRIAAIRALGSMGDEKHAVARLVPLLDDSSREIVIVALDAIDDNSDIDLTDVDAAKRWWEDNRDLDQLAWLQRRNEQLRTRIQRLDVSNDELTTRLLNATRAAYRIAPETERDKLLLDLLLDPLASVRLLGVDLVNAIITDRKTVPREVAARLATMVDDPNPNVRRQTAGVLGDLRDKALVPRLTSVLAKETDSRVRAAIVGALGRIGGPGAEKAVQSALDDPSPVVVADAATALGALAERGVGTAEGSVTAIAALRARYERVGSDDDTLRETFLNAMVRIEAVEFRPYFLAALAPELAVGVRRAGIRGVAVTDDGSSAELLRPLLTEANADIRAAGAEALGRCGKSDDDLTSLISRLDPAVESEEPIRQKAWESVQRILKSRAVEDQIAWADRMQRPGDKAAVSRRVELLSLIDRRLSEQSPVPALRMSVVERLGDANSELGQFSAAASFYEQAWTGSAGVDAARANRNVGKAFSALLAARGFDGAFAMLDRARASTNGKSVAIDFQDVAQRVEAAIGELIAKEDAAAAVELARMALERLPTDAELATDRRKSLMRLRDRATELADSKRIQDLIGQVGRDEAKAPEAQAALKVLGGRALPALVAELERRIGRGPTADAAEMRIVATIRRIESRWAGYELQANAPARRKALNALRALLPQTQPASRPTSQPTSRPSPR